MKMSYNKLAGRTLVRADMKQAHSGYYCNIGGKMKKLISILITVFFAFTNFACLAADAKTTSVKGYRKKSGKYVQAYTRKAPAKKQSSGKRRK